MSVNLSIKGVPDELAQRLRERAERNRHSLQRELLSIIEAAAYPGGSPQTIDRSSHCGGGRNEAPKSIDEIVDSLRARFPDPQPGASLGVDILRAARDGR